MKKTILLLLLAVIVIDVGAQALINKINISDTKTVHLIFAENIQYVDIGSSMIAVQHFDNIVKIKAKAPMDTEPESNITVISVSGKIFVGELQYLKTIHQYVVNIPLSVMRIQDSRGIDIGLEKLAQWDEGNATATKSLVEEQKIRVSTVRGQRNIDRVNSSQASSHQFELDRKVIEDIISESSELNRIGDVEQGIIISLAGIYAYNDLVLFKVDIKNTTAISYDIDYETFIVEEKKAFDKKAIQEEQLEILEVITDKRGSKEYKTDLNNIGPNERMTRVYVLRKFNSASTKKLRYEIWENMAYRTLNFDIPIKEISKAKLLKKTYKVRPQPIN